MPRDRILIIDKETIFEAESFIRSPSGLLLISYVRKQIGSDERQSRWQIQNNGETFFLGKIEMNSGHIRAEILRFHFGGNLLLQTFFEATFHNTNTQIQRYPSFDNRDAFFLSFASNLFAATFCVDSRLGNVGRQRRCENCWKIKYLSFMAVRGERMPEIPLHSAKWNLLLNCRQCFGSKRRRRWWTRLRKQTHFKVIRPLMESLVRGPLHFSSGLSKRSHLQERPECRSLCWHLFYEWVWMERSAKVLEAGFPAIKTQKAHSGGLSLTNWIERTLSL